MYNIPKIPLVGALAAVFFGLSLFAVDILNLGMRATVEAISLILIGLSFMSLCFTACRGQDRYHWRMVMGITFCLWGIEAIMPAGLLRLLVRDLVVFLFILDLVLIIFEQNLHIKK